MKDYLTFDVGGTTIKTAIINDNLELSEHEVFPTNHNRNNAILKTIIQVSKDKAKNHDIKGIGISTGGIVDPSDGSILYAGPTIPHYMGTKLQYDVSQATNLPVKVINDVNAALLGESINGGAQGYHSVYCIALGTGIGGAFLNNGKLYYGSNNQANSIGYMMYDPKDHTNFENRTSTIALDHLLHHKFNIDPKDAFEIYYFKKDSPITSFMDNWFDQLGANIANIILVLDPQLILIGGAVSAQENRLVDPLKKAIIRHLPSDFMKTEIHFAKLHNLAPLYGSIYDFIENNLD